MADHKPRTSGTKIHGKKDTRKNLKKDKLSHSGIANKSVCKKGGSGGKHNWGSMTEDYTNAPAFLDKGDPNYDASARE